MKKIVLLLVFLSPLSAFAFSSLSEQAAFYQDLFGSPSNSYTSVNKSLPFVKGETRPKVVLKGVFYFGGTDTKRDNLSNNYRQLLCESGFSQASAIYDKIDTVVKCDGNSMKYDFIGQASLKNNGGARVRSLLENLYGIIKSDGNEGPVYVHCWYGVHASNTIAQIVLKQFCGISDETALSNWDKVDLYNGLGEKGVQENFAKVRAFTPYSDLQITPAEKRTICF